MLLGYFSASDYEYVVNTTAVTASGFATGDAVCFSSAEYRDLDGA